jgi:ABC-type sugar transport system permease subunit
MHNLRLIVRLSKSLYFNSITLFRVDPFLNNRLTTSVQHLRKMLKYSSTAYLFILPGFAIYFAFVLFPIIKTFINSFYDWKGFGTAKFIGLENYAVLLKDTDFWNAFSHNVYFIIFYTIIPILLGLFLTALGLSHVLS